MIAGNCTEHAHINKRDLEKFSLDIRECVNMSRIGANHAEESHKYVKELREIIAGLFCTTMCLVVILFSLSWAFAHVKFV